MKITNIRWVLDPDTFQRDLVATVDVPLSLETILDLAGVHGLDLHSEIAMVLGQELLTLILANKPPING